MDNINKLIKENYNFIKKYNKGQIVFNENDLCEYVGYVLSGSIIIVSYTYSGKEILFNRCNKNQIFGQTLIFSSAPFYKGSVVSNDNTTILFISKKKLLDILIKNNQLEFFLKIISDEVLKAKETSRLLAFDKTKDRLLYLLFIKKEIKIKSINQLAKDINVSRETLSKTISSLKKEKVINYENKVITLNL